MVSKDPFDYVIWLAGLGLVALVILMVAPFSLLVSLLVFVFVRGLWLGFLVGPLLAVGLILLFLLEKQEKERNGSQTGATPGDSAS